MKAGPVDRRILEEGVEEVLGGLAHAGRRIVLAPVHVVCALCVGAWAWAWVGECVCAGESFGDNEL